MWVRSPVSVMSSVCSNCADGRPSAVTAVHLSGHVTGTLLPLRQNWKILTYLGNAKILRLGWDANRQIMGSMVKV